MDRYDVAIVGLGAMGSAAALQLARRGARVIGFDRFVPPHALGSSHGETRVTRLAIGEGDHLTPLVMRSHALWREIERESGAKLLSETGALIISSERNAAQTHVAGFFAKTLAAAEKFAIAHEVVDAAQIRTRWPQFDVADDEVGYFEPTAGFVRPEDCVRAQLDLARKHGAQTCLNETVRAFEATPNGVHIDTDKGTYSASRLILAAGAWLPGLRGPRYASLFKIYRQAQIWFEVDDPAAFAPARFPVFIWELQNSARGIYGFPALNGARAIKVASEEFTATTSADAASREVSKAEIAAVADLVVPNIRGVTRCCVRATTCLYTVTPDFGFVIDVHPEYERVLIASPCSGHGFKHSPAIGEALAQLALGEPCGFDLTPFRLSRLTKIARAK
ncbi:MAG: N-methyl-L-tryptophan oxidase [Alphaproteobacteria bacterium]